MHLGRWRLVIAGFGMAVIGFLIWLANSDDALEMGDKLGSVFGALIGLAGLFVGLLGLRNNATTTTTGDPGQALEDLARLVTRQWEREAGARGLTRQEPLDVRWASTERPVAPSAAEVVGADAMAARPKRLKLRGGVDELADALWKLPGHQLVLLGEPGSGKTSAAALLTLRLLDRRQTGDAAPVLLSLASWDPKAQDLETWMTQRISVDHPAFRKRGAHGPEVARDLIERGMVLPVLDALDEVASKVEAVREIANVVGRNKPMVLTCRADDYEEIIRETGVPVGRAAVVELKPVDAAEAARYLEAGTQENEQRWQPVVTALLREPAGVLARALSTPLAIYLARTAYRSPLTDPADLLAHTTSTAVEHQLLDSYLPALYPVPDAAKARRRFAFLARRLAVNPVAGNLAWWRLFLLLPAAHVITSATRFALISAASVFGLAVLNARSETADIRSTAIWGMPALVMLLAAAVVMSLLGALAGWASTVLVMAIPHTEKVFVPPPKNLVLTWQRVTRLFATQMTIGLLLMFLVGTFVLPEMPLTSLLVVGLLGGIGVSVYSLATTIAVDAPVDTPTALAGDRKATLTYVLSTIAVYCAVGLTLVSTEEPLTLEIAGFMIWLAAVLVCWWQFTGAWVKFGIARFWFAVFRKLPWRLMHFLDDAHQRGVLRQVGAAYEFRHQRLQQYFSQREEGAPKPAPLPQSTG
ncbi:hypothetical protein ACWGE0_31820 [Lentzea sp. NPDC054927]